MNWKTEMVKNVTLSNVKIIEKTETTTMTNTIKNKIQKDTNLSNWNDI